MSNSSHELQIEYEIDLRISQRELRSAASSWLAYGLQAKIMYSAVPSAFVWCWVALMMATEGTDLYIAYLLKKNINHPERRRLYASLLTVSLFIAGSCWGVSSFLPGMQSDSEGYIANVFILVVVAVFSIHNLSLRWQNLAAFSFGALWPTFTANVGGITEFEVEMSLTCLTSLIAIQFYGYGNRKLEYNEIKQRLEVERLARTLHSQNTELEMAMQKISDLASQDPLTHCLNRRALSERFETIRKRPHDIQSGLGIIILDVDYFKSINDQRGHHTGDAVLVTLAEKIRSNLRAEDYLGRWGGEEFVCIVPNVNLNGLAELAERLRASIEEMIINDRSDPFSITASMGVAVASHTDALEHVVSAADRALYRAKESGRNRVCIA